MNITLEDPVLAPVADLKPFPGNARRGDLEAIAESLLANGQYQPLIVRRHADDPAWDGVVLAGNHTLRAARNRKAKRVAVQWLACSDDEARRINLYDNRGPERGETDRAALASILDNLAAAGQLAGTGYDVDAVDDLLAAVGADVLDPQAFTGDYAETPEEHAARAARLAGRGSAPSADPDAGGKPPAARPFLLVMSAPEWADYQANVALLRRTWGVDTPAAVILRAVREASR